LESQTHTDAIEEYVDHHRTGAYKTGTQMSMRVIVTVIRVGWLMASEETFHHVKGEESDYESDHRSGDAGEVIRIEFEDLWDQIKSDQPQK
jgi:hypothetical protein